MVLRSRVDGLIFIIYGYRFRLQDSGLRFSVCDSRFTVLGYNIRV